MQSSTTRANCRARQIAAHPSISVNSPLPVLCAYAHNTGFEFGYGGSGPAQLALAILADALGDDEQAKQHYQRFKREKISRLEDSPWVITQEEVRSWIERVLKA